MGTILIPDVGFDHFDSLWARVRRPDRHSRADVLDGSLDLLSVRLANHKDVLDASERQALECPIEKGRVADGEQTLRPPDEARVAKAPVEAVCEDDGLEDIVLARQILLLAG